MALNTKEKIRRKNIEILKDPLFKPADFFMIRSTILPVNRFRELSDENLIYTLREYAESEYIRESVLIASPGLYRSLPNIYNPIKDKRTQKVASSFLRYLLRMVSRPTPFGTFSGISSGSFRDKTSIVKNNQTKLRKRTRPDMEWLLGVVNLLENDFNIIKNVKVKANHAAFQLGTRLYLPFATECGQLKKKNVKGTDKVSVRFTSIVEQVLRIADSPIKLDKIITSLIERYPEVPQKKIQSFVWELFQQEFLLSELRPPLTLASPFDYLIGKLKSIDDKKSKEILRKLTTLRELISNYDTIPVGKGIEQYLNMISNMKELCDIANPLQVDTRVELNSCFLNKSVGEEIAKSAEVLWKLSNTQVGFSHLKEYHLDFLEKYGTAREIPVLELLSDEKGLGEPENYSNQQIPGDGNSNVDTMQQDMDFAYILLDAIYNQKHEIKLTDELVEKLAMDNQEEKFAPDTLEVYAEVFAGSLDKLDKGDYKLCIGPNPGSSSAGSTFGRFLDMLEPEVHQGIQELQGYQDYIFNDDTVFVEGTFLPPNGRSANVALGKSTRNYELAIGTNPNPNSHSLGLDDILVGATLKGLYLKSKSLNKQIKIMAGNMLNFKGAPVVYRFLREVSLNDVAHWGQIGWGKLGISPYFPRISYNRTVLAPAIWKLNTRMIDLEKKPKDEDIFIQAINEWRKKWSVPRYVYMTYGDNRILIDMENTYHLREVENELYKHSRLQLREVIAPMDQCIVNEFDNKFVSEIVVPLKKENMIERREKIELSYKRKINEKNIICLPGGEWLYIKLFVPLSREDEFIRTKLADFVNSVLEEKLANLWFFIRYNDSSSDIRLRFRGDPQTLSGDLLPKIKNWVDQCMDECIIKKMSIDTYEKEMERYGGPLLISEAENWFCQDSTAVTQLLKLEKSGKLPQLPIHAIASLNIIYIMDKLGMSFEWQLDWITSITDKYRFSDEFRPYRKTLLNLANRGASPMEGIDYDKIAAFYHVLSTLDKPLTDLGQKIYDLKKSGELWNKDEMVIGSLIHMHCNRLMGINKESETKALAFVRHLLFSQRFWRGKA